MPGNSTLLDRTHVKLKALTRKALSMLWVLVYIWVGICTIPRPHFCSIRFSAVAWSTPSVIFLENGGFVGVEAGLPPVPAIVLFPFVEILMLAGQRWI